MSSLQFNAVLLDISNRLSPDELHNLKFLERDIGKRELEKVNTGLKLFQILMQRGKLSADNTQHLSQLLALIKRQDLIGKLNDFESPSEPTENQPEPAERDKLDAAAEVIAENLGRNWRKLGRKLGLTDVKLESVSKKHPTDLEETTLELLKEWRKSKRADATTENLIAALRACQQNLTADKVEDRLKALEN
ncbi:FAS-associated death domain protein [Stegastes partitus]|uniref:FAS-associated death domain protein n=1 Tax=Stegastes partitus TaxID=144197 RepID=A0A3B5BEZ8_9TELE|nr:PREDICTED: FAS-associated death domain protein [Stegastes partitus]